MIEFQVSTKHAGDRQRIKVMVYDTVEQLRRACRKRDGFYGVVQATDGWYDQMVATTNSIEAYDYADGQESNVRQHITIRFARDRLKHYGPTEIIVHESTHAAIRIYRTAVNKPLDEIENEETLCYLVGDISRKVVNKLYEKGVM